MLKWFDSVDALTLCTLFLLLTLPCYCSLELGYVDAYDDMLLRLYVVMDIFGVVLVFWLDTVGF